jgi:hypothetical protein
MGGRVVPDQLVERRWVMKKATRRALLARVERSIAEKQEIEDIRRRRVLGRVDLSRLK